MSCAKLTSSDTTPLCVDLDGTLINGDMFVECIRVALLRRPWAFCMACMLLLFRTKAKAKKYLFYKVGSRVRTPPFCGALVGYLQEQKKHGRPLYLVTATYEPLARQVTKSLRDIFTEIYGTTDDFNLKGKNKAQFLVDRFGEKGFDYVGDTEADYAVWSRARKVYVVTQSARFLRQVLLKFNVEKCFSHDKERSHFPD